MAKKAKLKTYGPKPMKLSKLKGMGPKQFKARKLMQTRARGL